LGMWNGASGKMECLKTGSGDYRLGRDT